MPRKKVFICLGSNIGGRARYIESAINGIEDLCYTTILSKSKVMETKPIGVKGQRDYLNQIILISTELEPKELLGELKRIERELGRKTRNRWAEREIDIDILIYEGVILNSSELTIPHKELRNRPFVLKGLSELDPDCVVDGLGCTIKDLVKGLDT